MVLYLLQTNCLIKYCINHAHLGFFSYEGFVYCNDSELIWGHILLTPILKPHQEPPLTINYLNHTSQLLPHLPVKSFPNVISQLNCLCLRQRPHQDIVPPASVPTLCVNGIPIRIRNNRRVHVESIVSPVAVLQEFQASGCFILFLFKKTQTEIPFPGGSLIEFPIILEV